MDACTASSSIHFYFERSRDLRINTRRVVFETLGIERNRGLDKFCEAGRSARRRKKNRRPQSKESRTLYCASPAFAYTYFRRKRAAIIKYPPTKTAAAMPKPPGSISGAGGGPAAPAIAANASTNIVSSTILRMVLFSRSKESRISVLSFDRLSLGYFHLR